jgi:hypothetical protein
MTENNDEFDFRLWILDTHISEKGLAKLATHEVKDRESLLVLSATDVKEMKLATADRAKFTKALSEFRGTDKQEPPPASPQSPDAETDQSKSQATVVTEVSEDVSAELSSETIKYSTQPACPNGAQLGFSWANWAQLGLGFDWVLTLFHVGPNWALPNFLLYPK